MTNQDLAFTYNALNQLVETKRGPPESEVVLGLYDYNSSGLRVRHRLSERGDVDYYYDDRAVIEERNATDDTLLAHYRYADRLISLDMGGAKQYYHHDALGSTVNLTTDSAATQVSYKLDPWGHIREQVGASINRQIFTGQEHDENTGLIYFGARYYDPDTACFISQDSYLGENNTPPTLHRYLYAYSNLLRFIDLMGYSAWDDFKHGGREFLRMTKETPGIIVRTLKQGAKQLPTLANEVSKVPDQVFEDVAPESTVGQLAATAVHTGFKVIVGTAMSPVDTAAQTVTFAEDPKAENISILGPVADNLAKTSSDFAENPGWDTGLQVMGATGGAVLTAFAPVQAGRYLDAPGFEKSAKITVEDPSGSAAKLDKPTDPKNVDNVLSGHGAFRPQDGFVEVPEGTSVTPWTKHGNPITDKLGNYIETGKEISYLEFGDEITGARSYLPGSKMPNYTLYPPEGLNIMGNPTTVTSPTNLDNLIKPDQGNVKWAACQEVKPYCTKHRRKNMTYYKDLSSYEYFKTKAKGKILNVGWLDKKHKFKKGEVDSTALEIIFSFCRRAINKTRGFHSCPFCDEPSFGLVVKIGNEKNILGSGEIWIKGEEGKVYAAPDLIYHYIKDHGYMPPNEFLIAAKKGEMVVPE